MNVAKGIQASSQVMLDQLRDMQSKAKFEASQNAQSSQSDKGSFLEMLQNSVTEVNQSQVDSDKMATDLTTGKSQNIHETMVAATQAELKFNLMVQVRNKVLEAYQEVMRMQI